MDGYEELRFNEMNGRRRERAPVDRTYVAMTN
jgi:hypothetical protein